MTTATPTRPDDYQAESRRLMEWAFANAAYYRKHAPLLTADIQNFEDTGALLDSYRAGLVLVAPHPAMRAELIRWVSVQDALPDDGELVLFWGAEDDSPWLGYLDGAELRSAEGLPFPMMSGLFWAAMPAGPASTQPAEARHEEAQP